MSGLESRFGCNPKRLSLLLFDVLLLLFPEDLWVAVFDSFADENGKHGPVTLLGDLFERGSLPYTEHGRDSLCELLFAAQWPSLWFVLVLCHVVLQARSIDITSRPVKTPMPTLGVMVITGLY